MSRPDYKSLQSGVDFKNWYWRKDEMIAICKHLKISYAGSKFELRDRIIFALDNNGKEKRISKKKPTSRFNWTKTQLTLDTLITDNISFGQNLRKFMIAEIGDNFSFNTVFMKWARENSGKTLRDAVLKWNELEQLKKDPNFRSDIEAHNMFNQYVRDFLDDNPDRTFSDAKTNWLLTKELPAENGFVKYKKSDLDLIKRNKK